MYITSGISNVFRYEKNIYFTLKKNHSVATAPAPVLVVPLVVHITACRKR
jgi:hypothetical protein